MPLEKNNFTVILAKCKSHHPIVDYQNTSTTDNSTALVQTNRDPSVVLSTYYGKVLRFHLLSESCSSVDCL